MVKKQHIEIDKDVLERMQTYCSENKISQEEFLEIVMAYGIHFIKSNNALHYSKFPVLHVHPVPLEIQIKSKIFNSFKLEVQNNKLQLNEVLTMMIALILDIEDQRYTYLKTGL